MVFQSLFFVVAAYLLGSVPFGKIIAKTVARIDITRRGSGNIGATNVARELSVKWGLLTLLLDMLKGLIPVVLFRFTFSEPSADAQIGLCAVAISALLGHQFSLFLKFRGGKGVSTALGIYLGISPVSCLLALLLFIAVVCIYDFVSLGSMVSASAMPALLAVFGSPFPVVISSLTIASLICLKHMENIQRLINGEEKKWRGRKD